uniref:C3H1-type domain-containing protein n=1 Tax=Physcomitrium patens TaxID=3218 RepID=A0A2K1ICT4_PHYPA|nr:hypothetical protein PHYPA_030565 [Physcomitrium patens]
MWKGLWGLGVIGGFNHPANRKLGAVVARGKGEYPERVGQPECQYYLKTGTCKFGATCKYHHPREKAGSTGRVLLNVLGLPLRLGEKECAYYMRTGSCKYGVTCKFHHPQPATVGGMVPVPFGSGGGPSSPAPQGYAAGALPSWPLARSPYPLPRLQTHSSYGPMLPLQQGIMSMPGWSYQGPVGPADGHQQGYVFGGAPQGEHVSGFGPYMQGSSAVGLPAHQATQSVVGQKESLFPERLGQPECQYYMKTGECKFGTTCRYHHPKDRSTPSSTCHLSAMGLPLRPGNPPCSFYTRYGICKFGPTCKFDHPLVGSLTYSPSAGSLADVPVAPYPIGSSPMNLAPSAYSEGLLERQGSGEAGGYAEDGIGHHVTSRSNSEGGGVSSGSGVNGGVGGAGSGSGPTQAESVGKS